MPRARPRQDEQRPRRIRGRPPRGDKPVRGEEDTGIPKLCPVQPYALPRDMRRQIGRIVADIVERAAIQGGGHELFVRVYTAGLYHGHELTMKRVEAVGFDGFKQQLRGIKEREIDRIVV